MIHVTQNYKLFHFYQDFITKEHQQLCQSVLALYSQDQLSYTKKKKN